MPSELIWYDASPSAACHSAQSHGSNARSAIDMHAKLLARLSAMMAVNNVADNLGLSTDMASTEKYILSTCQVLFVCTTHTMSCHALPCHGPAASGKPHMSQLSWKVMTTQCMKSNLAKA